ncbi:Ribonuclease P protein subunit p21 [Mortierella sp. AD094]|nr:Ribonuclease P protein subunit p21 [Mortierella sp. AD094]
MAKKDKKGDGAVQNREIFQRMNFLYQAAMCMATITTPQPTPNPNSNTAQNATNLNTVEKGSNDHANSTRRVSTENPTTEAAENKDVDMEEVSGTNPHSAADIASTHPVGKLSRRKKRELLRLRKNRIAMEQISNNGSHHKLTNPTRNHDLYQHSGVARFYASTMREVGRKNVIRIDPVVKRSICQRCEALLMPSISCEVRIQATPQLHTIVTCTACGAFRRFFCMSGKGIEHNESEVEHETAAPEILPAEELSNHAETQSNQARRGLD